MTFSRRGHVREPLAPGTAARITAAAMLLWLAGCATQPAPPLPGASWADNRSHLQALQTWTAQGKLALRSERGAESASFDWHQQGAGTRVQLQGPLGVNATTLVSDGRQLEIRQGDEQTRWDLSEPDRIARETGWQLPLTALPHWLRGVPAPQLAVEGMQLEQQRLRTLRQGGWEIRYDEYAGFGSYTLPTRLEIQRGDTSARVIIRSWRPGSDP